MSRKTTTTLVVVLVTLVALVYLWTTTGCTIDWAKPDDGRLTLEQKGVLVKIAAKRALIEVWREEPGLWKDHVCSVATIILKALDGDSTAITELNTRLEAAFPDRNLVMIAPSDTSPSSITIEARDLLLGLLAYTAGNWDMDGWAGAAADAIELFDAFLLTGVTTDYEVWYLTREFFAGIVEGCAVVGRELHE